jgi:hypothetical protein
MSTSELLQTVFKNQVNAVTALLRAVEGKLMGGRTTFHPLFRFCKGFECYWWKVEAVNEYPLSAMSLS